MGFKPNITPTIINFSGYLLAVCRLMLFVIGGCLYASVALANVKIIVIDRSGSMTNTVDVEDTGPHRLYDVAVSESKREIELLLKNPENKISVIFFNTEPSGPFDIDSLKAFNDLVQQYPPTGSTNIGDPLMEVFKIVSDNPDERIYDISLYTDGEQTVKPKHSIASAIGRLTGFFAKSEKFKYFGVQHFKWGNDIDYALDRYLLAMKQELKRNQNVVVENRESTLNNNAIIRTAVVTMYPTGNQVVSLAKEQTQQTKVTFPINILGSADTLASQSKLKLKVSVAIQGESEILAVVDEPLFDVEENINHLLYVTFMGNRPFELKKAYRVIVKIEPLASPSLINDPKVKVFTTPDEFQFEVMLVEQAHFAIMQPNSLHVQQDIVVAKSYRYDQYPAVNLVWNEEAVGLPLKVNFVGAKKGIGLSDGKVTYNAQNDTIVLGKDKTKNLYLGVSEMPAQALEGSVNFSLQTDSGVVESGISYFFEGKKATVKWKVNVPAELEITPGDATQVFTLEINADKYARGGQAEVAIKQQKGFETILKTLDGRVISDKDKVDLTIQTIYQVQIKHQDLDVDVATFSPELNTITITPIQPFIDVVNADTEELSKKVLFATQLKKIDARWSCDHPPEGFILTARMNVKTPNLTIGCEWNKTFANEVKNFKIEPIFPGNAGVGLSDKGNEDKEYLIVNIPKDTFSHSFEVALLPHIQQKLKGHLVMTAASGKIEIPISLDVHKGNYQITALKKAEKVNYESPVELYSLAIDAQNAVAGSTLKLTGELIDANYVVVHGADGLPIQDLKAIAHEKQPLTILSNLSLLESPPEIVDYNLTLSSNDPSMTVSGQSIKLIELSQFEQIIKPQLEWTKDGSKVRNLKVNVTDTLSYVLDKLQLSLKNKVSDEQQTAVMAQLALMQNTPVKLTYYSSPAIKDVVFKASATDLITVSNLLNNTTMELMFKQYLNKPLWGVDEQRIKIVLIHPNVEFEQLNFTLQVQGRVSTVFVILLILIVLLLWYGINHWRKGSKQRARLNDSGPIDFFTETNSATGQAVDVDMTPNPIGDPDINGPTPKSPAKSTSKVKKPDVKAEEIDLFGNDD